MLEWSAVRLEQQVLVWLQNFGGSFFLSACLFFALCIVVGLFVFWCEALRMVCENGVPCAESDICICIHIYASHASHASHA